VIRPDAKTVTMAYNAADELIRKDMPALPGVPADVVEFDFDGMGRLVSATDNDTEIVNTYDLASRVTQTDQTFGVTHSRLDSDMMCSVAARR